jgi:Entner-Doudoroff aldolase
MTSRVPDLTGTDVPTSPTDFNQFFDEAFADTPVMAILRGYSPSRTVELANRAWDLGITQVEVPIQEPDAIPSLTAAIASAAERGLGVGAGTVVTPEQVHIAHTEGATFTVSPGYDRDVVEESHLVGLPHLPGVSTPSEIGQAQRRGLNWVKAFPASHLGPSWMSAVRAPFPQLRIVVTGGVDADNAASFLHAGARVAALGSALADPTQLEKVLTLLPANHS